MSTYFIIASYVRDVKFLVLFKDSKREQGHPEYAVQFSTASYHNPSGEFVMTWYIVKNLDQSCAVTEDLALAETASEKWGPYPTRDEAIAKRIGLIRAGKCQPV